MISLTLRLVRDSSIVSLHSCSPSSSLLGIEYRFAIRECKVGAGGRGKTEVVRGANFTNGFDIDEITTIGNYIIATVSCVLNSMFLSVTITTIIIGCA